MKPPGGTRVLSVMESRGLVVVSAGVLLLAALCALAVGWMHMADDALAAKKRCELTQYRQATSLPTISIAGDAIVFENELVATTSSVLLGDSPTFKIDALFEKLDKLHRKPCDPNRVCLDNLVVLRTAEPVDSHLLQKIANTVWAAGFDLVHAPRHSHDSW